MGLDQNLAVLLGLGGKVQPPLHGFTSARQRLQTSEEPRLAFVKGYRGAKKVPFSVESHQLVDVEAEANVRDGAAGVGLTAGREGANRRYITKKIMQIKKKKYNNNK